MGDKIIVNDIPMSLLTNPLESYWNGVDRKRPKIFPLGSHCWRGYIATWDIIDKQLYLLDIEGSISITEIFGVSKGERVKADWFTGELRIPLGNILHHFDGSQDPIYEKEAVIKIENGNMLYRIIAENNSLS